MTLLKGSLLLTHLIALTNFSALIMNDFFHPGWAALGIGLIGASSIGALLGKTLNLSSRFWNALSLSFCLFFIVDAMWLSRDLLPAGMHFLTYLMGYRLLHLETSKDELQLYLISFLQLFAAAGDGSHFSYAVSFLLSSFLMVWGLLLQHFKREEEARAPDLLHRPIREVLPYRFFIMTPFLSMALLTLTVLFFFMIPRVGVAFFQKRGPSSQKISGFSEKVDLGSMGPVKQDRSLVMRVIPNNDLKGASPSYLRGISFDRYDGKAWQNTLLRKTQLIRNTDERFTLGPAPEGLLVSKKTVFLEPLDTQVLFTAGKTVSIRGPFSRLFVDQSGSLYFPSNRSRQMEYELAGVTETFSDSDRKEVRIDYPREIRDHYLPAGDAETGIDPKITALAEAVTAPYTTVYDKTAAVENYLKTNYTYSLDLSPSSRPPIEEFLFFQKKGYCEQYASAMVLMLRSIGIASRLVTGFLPGEWNEFGQYFLIRQSDAHAWVEVYFPGGRWLSFDPTPAVLPEPQRLFIKEMTAYLDWMRLKWDRYIIRYSLKDQFDAVQGAGDRLGTLSGRLLSIAKWWKGPLQEASGRLTFIMGISVLGALLLFLTRRRMFGVRKSAGRSAVSASYEEMLRILAKRGLIKKEQQTPFEFLENLRAAGLPLSDGVEGITRTYCRVRFGGKTLSTEEAVRIEALLDRLRTMTSSPVFQGTD